MFLGDFQVIYFFFFYLCGEILRGSICSVQAMQLVIHRAFSAEAGTKSLRLVPGTRRSKPRAQNPTPWVGNRSAAPEEAVSLLWRTLRSSWDAIIRAKVLDLRFRRDTFAVSSHRWRQKHDVELRSFAQL